MYELLDLPIPVEGRLNEDIESCVNSLLESCGHDEVTINRLDGLVYHLYDLTYDEVLVVDPDTPISREQYESGQYGELQADCATH